MQHDLRKIVKNFDRAQEEDQTAQFAAEHQLPYVNLVNYPFVGDVLGLIPEETANKFSIVAFMKIGQSLRVATSNPFNPELATTMNELGIKLDMKFEPFVCSPSSMDYALSRYPMIVQKAKDNSINTKPGESIENELKSLKDVQQAISTVSTTELLETIIGGATILDASDIHFEPMQDKVHVRFRVDGKLLPIFELPEKTYKPLSSRIMTSSKIKLDLKTVAQDGRMTVEVNGNPLDIRVNVLPSAYGQTIVLRLLNYKNFLTLDQLDFNDNAKAAMLEAVAKPEGLVLFTGPTGSGKTTSLYAVLQILNSNDRKIITIEDPVEYRIDGIEQIQINAADGFDFPQALRAVLRQDPNVIMVGEIRDKETAEIAVNAALTGHLVLSTLHTNSAAAAFARLLQMGVPKYLMADAIALVVAQRLVRKVCEVCRGSGCETCNMTGFKGRILISEYLKPDSEIIELIKREASLSEFQKHFAEAGGRSLLQDGLDKVAQGITTEEEVRSVTA